MLYAMDRAEARNQGVETPLAEINVGTTPELSLIQPPVAPPTAPIAESNLKRWSYLAIAIAFALAFCFVVVSFTAPAPGRPGVDENAYLVGGRMIAEHGTTGFKPSDDYQFVGAMWVRIKSGWYYPKYPFGTSLLNAVMILIGHPEWAFMVSPICASIAILAMFFLARPIVGSFYALLGMILLAMGPTTIQLAIIPNSHAPALCFVVCGMCLLLSWWRTGRWWVGALAGLSLGYAVTIRYTEALLLFPLYPFDVVKADQFLGPKLIAILKVFGLLPIGPIGIAAMSRVKWKSWRTYLPASVPVLAWAIPVGALVTFNWFSVGHLTGYDTTNESSGFSLNYFVDKWQFAVDELYLIGLFVIAPLAIAGLVLMYRTSWRMALLLTAWFVPGTFLYMTYYWGQNVPGVWYLRFFLTMFPAAIVAAMYLLRSTQEHMRGSIVTPLAAGIITAAAAGVGLWISVDELVRQHRGNMNLHYSEREIVSHIKPSPGGRPMILADEGMFPQLLQYMQFMYDADWYASDIFAIRGGGGFGLAGVFDHRKPNDDTPTGLQADRIDYIDSVRKGKTDADFIAEAQHLMEQRLNSNRRVYVVLVPEQTDYFKHRFMHPGLEMVQVNRWSEPCRTTFPENNKHSELEPMVIPDSQFLPWHPMRREMYEIRHAATTQPTSALSAGIKVANR
jgi:hypothetical protein